MSDVGRYRKLYPRLWRHPGFCNLRESARLLALYLLTGPQTNRLGIFVLSVATAAEDLGVSVETVRKGLTDIGATFGWMFDRDARVFYIPSWWHWNPPENLNVLKGNLKDLNEIPPSALTEAFATNLQTLAPTFHETFMEGISERLHHGSRNQDQYQDLKQKQDLRASRGVEREQKPSNGQCPEKLVSIARRAIRLTDPASSTQDLLDTFHHVARDESWTGYTSAQAAEAVSIALSERRRGT